MPLLDILSAMNRAVVCEVGDVEDDQALAYLMKNDIPEDKARELISLIGGRIIHLETCTCRKKLRDCPLEDIRKTAKDELFDVILPPS